MEQYFRGIKGLEMPRYANDHPKYDNQTMLPKLCYPNYGNRGMVSEVWCRGILPRRSRANEYSPDTLFSLQGQEQHALPRMDLVRQSGLPRPGRAEVRRSALFSLPPSAAGLEIAQYLYGVSAIPTSDLRS